MTLKDKLIIYVHNKGTQLENEKNDLKFQRQFMSMDSLDIFENMRADIRIDAFNEFVQELFKIIMYCDIKPTKPPHKSK